MISARDFANAMIIGAIGGVAGGFLLLAVGAVIRWILDHRWGWSLDDWGLR